MKRGDRYEMPSGEIAEVISINDRSVLFMTITDKPFDRKFRAIELRAARELRRAVDAPRRA